MTERRMINEPITEPILIATRSCKILATLFLVLHTFHDFCKNLTVFRLFHNELATHLTLNKFLSFIKTDRWEILKVKLTYYETYRKEKSDRAHISSRKQTNFTIRNTNWLYLINEDGRRYGFIGSESSKKSDQYKENYQLRDSIVGQS